MEAEIQSQGEQRLIPARMIIRGDERQVKNPRTNKDPLFMHELKANIKEVGLLQPILVRPMGDKFEVVAGECRLDTLVELYGEDVGVPSLVMVLSDEAAHVAASAENIERAPMNAVEEAEAAAKMLRDCGGDRAEAARRMGWTPPTLDKRLSLMYATDSVRAALLKGVILLGHAELLAVCRKETQEAALASLLDTPKRMSVEALKAYINSASLVLDTAIFDKEDCASCHHNSGNQGALFTVVIDGGRCTNKQCFSQKTDEKLEATAASLRDEFQVVRIVRPGENFTVIPLVVDGPKGVGPEQALACRTCGSYGAAVSAAPDKLGRVFKNLCMDVPCNVRKVAANIAGQKAGQQAQGTMEGGSSPTGGTATSATGKPQTPTKAGGRTQQVGKKSATSEPSMRVKEYREKLWRLVYKRVISKAELADNRSVLLALCLTHPGHINSEGLKADLKDLLALSSAPSFGSVLQAVRDLDQKALGQALGAIAANVKDGSIGMDLKDVVSALKSFEVKLEDHWKVTTDFFALLTKNEIDAVAEELGIKAAMGKEFAKARLLGKDDFIAAIMAVPGFDYRGRIPKLVTW